MIRNNPGYNPACRSLWLFLRYCSMCRSMCACLTRWGGIAAKSITYSISSLVDVQLRARWRGRGPRCYLLWLIRNKRRKKSENTQSTSPSSALLPLHLIKEGKSDIISVGMCVRVSMFTHRQINLCRFVTGNSARIQRRIVGRLQPPRFTGSLLCTCHYQGQCWL